MLCDSIGVSYYNSDSLYLMYVRLEFEKKECYNTILLLKMSQTNKTSPEFYSLAFKEKYFIKKKYSLLSIIRIDKYSVYTICAIGITGRKCKFIAFLSLTNTWYYLFYVARKK